MLFSFSCFIDNGWQIHGPSPYFLVISKSVMPIWLVVNREVYIVFHFFQWKLSFSSPPPQPIQKKKNLPHHSNAILHQFFLCYFYLGTLLITGYDDLFFFLFLSFQVIKAFLETSRRNSWAEIVHCRLICLLTNMFYQVPEDPTEGASSPIFLVDQVDLVGGTKFIFFEVC